MANIPQLVRDIIGFPPCERTEYSQAGKSHLWVICYRLKIKIFLVRIFNPLVLLFYGGHTSCLKLRNYCC